MGRTRAREAEEGERGDEPEASGRFTEGCRPEMTHRGWLAGLPAAGFVLCYLCLTTSAWLPVSGFLRGER